MIVSYNPFASESSLQLARPLASYRTAPCTRQYERRHSSEPPLLPSLPTVSSPPQPPAIYSLSFRCTPYRDEVVDGAVVAEEQGEVEAQAGEGSRMIALVAKPFST